MGTVVAMAVVVKPAARGGWPNSAVGVVSLAANEWWGWVLDIVVL